MNIFNLGRKHDQLRKEMDTLQSLIAAADIPSLALAVDEMQKALVDMQAGHNEDLKEIRERLDIPQRRKPTMRPWNMLRSAAEAGEQLMKEKKSSA